MSSPQNKTEPALSNSVNEFELIRQVANILQSQSPAPLQAPAGQVLSNLGDFDSASAILGGQDSRPQQRLKSATNIGRMIQANAQNQSGDTYSVYSKASKISTLSGVNRLFNGLHSQNQVQKIDKMKMFLRIWSGYTKFIRSQCLKDRIIDSVYFGTFYRNRDPKAKEDEINNQYVFIHDTKGSFANFKPMHNAENLPEIPQDVAQQREILTANISGIAQVCGCTTESVNMFLSKLKDQILHQLQQKKKSVVMNLPIGQLIFSPSETVEFRSASQNQEIMQLLTNEDLPSTSLPEGQNERNKSYNRSVLYKKGNKSKIKNMFKQNNNDLETTQEPKKLNHLSDFLRSQIVNRTSDKNSTGTAIQTYKSNHSNKLNNQLIEKAASEIQEARRSQQNQTYATQASSKAHSKIGSNKSLAMSGNDRRQQGIKLNVNRIESKSQTGHQAELGNLAKKDSRNGGDILSPRSYMKSAFTRGPQSNHSKSPYVGLKKQSDLMTEALKLRNSYQFESLPAKTGEDLNLLKSDTYSYQGKSRVQSAVYKQDKALSKVSSKIQSSRKVTLQSQTRPIPPNEAQFQDIGKLGLHYINNDNQTNKSLIHHGAHSMSLHQLMNFNKTMNPTIQTGPMMMGMNEETQFKSQNDLTPSQADSINKLIGNALDRKVISENYHYQAYPSFLRSNGPYRVYDHATTKGTKCVKNIQHINQQAQRRFQNELQKIKQVREFERKQFEMTKHKQDFIAEHSQQLNKKNNKNNFEYIQMQIKTAEQRKQEFEFREKQYYKPHFGPEETDDLIILEETRIANQKSHIRDQLNMQMQIKDALKQTDHQVQREGDLQNLKHAYNQFIAEEQAMRDKTVANQMQLKQDWEQQVKERKLKTKLENLFK